MGNIGFTGRTISKKLDSKIVYKGGLQNIIMPIIECKVGSELETTRVEIGGYPSHIHYNKFREEQHRKDKENKRKRSLKRQQKRLQVVNYSGDLSLEKTCLDSCRRFNS